MSVATKITLGSVTFDVAPRKKLKYTSPRSIARYDIPGGEPDYQDMGKDETILSWEGVLDGDQAYTHALQIEALKNAGQAVQLVVPDFPELSRMVRVRSFPFDIIRRNRVE
jgi:hypothetical protein